MDALYLFLSLLKADYAEFHPGEEQMNRSFLKIIRKYLRQKKDQR